MAGHRHDVSTDPSLPHELRNRISKSHKIATDLRNADSLFSVKIARSSYLVQAFFCRRSQCADKQNLGLHHVKKLFWKSLDRIPAILANRLIHGNLVWRVKKWYVHILSQIVNITPTLSEQKCTRQLRTRKINVPGMKNPSGTSEWRITRRGQQKNCHYIATLRESSEQTLDITLHPNKH